jgi:hypothetical protein
MFGCVQQSEDVIDETRLPASDACCAASLTQVLTREACRDEIHVRQRFERGHIVVLRNPGEPLFEDEGCRTILLRADMRLLRRHR